MRQADGHMTGFMSLGVQDARDAGQRMPISGAHRRCHCACAAATTTVSRMP
jgi:hypothetical protein